MAVESDTTSFIIRKAVEADLPTLIDFLAKLALHVSGAPPMKLRDQEHKRLSQVLSEGLTNQDKLIVVADVPDTGVAGMGYIFVWRSQGIWEQATHTEYRSGVIDDVWVEPDFRKMGLSTAILKELVGFAEEKGAHELILEYSLTNTEAEAVWTRIGFKPIGIRAAATTAAVKKALAPRG